MIAKEDRIRNTSVTHGIDFNGMPLVVWPGGYSTERLHSGWSQRRDMPLGTVLVAQNEPEATTLTMIFAIPNAMPGLHREFGGLGRNIDAILQFAGKYGLLGVREVEQKHEFEAGTMTRYAEPLDDWLLEIERMRIAISVSEALLAGDKIGEVYLRTGLADGTLATLAREFDGTYRDVRHLQWVVREGIQTKDVRSQAENLLDGMVARLLGSAITLKLPSQRSQPLVLRPHTLLGLITMCLIYEVLGIGVRKQRCSVCGSMFEQVDVRALYCSQACKARAYRERKRGGKNGN